MSAMIEVKVAELSGSALDWAVAKAQGVEIDLPGSDVVWAKYAGAHAPQINRGRLSAGHSLLRTAADRPCYRRDDYG